MDSEIQSKHPYVWRGILTVLFALFVASLFMVLTTLSSQMSIGEVIAWTTTVLSFMGILSTLFYGIVIDRITILIKSISEQKEQLATKEDLKNIDTQLCCATQTITEAYDLATKDLIKEAQKTGFTKIYKNRSEIALELSECLQRARREVKALGICISMPTRIAGFREMVQAKAKESVSFQFAYLKRNIKQEDNNFNFYKQRSLDENYPAEIGGLEDATTRNIDSLKTIRENLESDEKKQIQIREYVAFPYMSMTLIDDTIFIGSYLFGVTCPIIPMYKIVKKDGGIYETFYNHFLKLWESCEENEI